MSLLILREEIVCAVVISFILWYTSVYRIKTDNNCFMRILIYALGHVIFDIITVLTVNNIDVVPKRINDLCYIMFYAFGIAFIMAYYEYIVLRVTPRRFRRIVLGFKYVPAAVYIIFAYFFPVEYVSGRGTNYSYGPLAFMGYGVFVVYGIVSCVLVMISHRKLERRKKLTLYPMTFFLVILILLQAVIPELLMTSAAITFVCLGLFASFNNPAQEYKEQAFWDAATGIKNKNAYQTEMEQLEKRFAKKKTTIGFLLCDMNGLKIINDRYGHIEGDKLIRAATTTLNTYLEKAYNVYRVGGDEFVAIYLSPNEADVKKDIERVRKACELYHDSPMPLSMAMGYASGEFSMQYKDIYKEADIRMYEDKVSIKKNHPELCGR